MHQPAPPPRNPGELRGIADRHLIEAEERIGRLERRLARPRLEGRGRELGEELLAAMRRSREVLLECRATFGRQAGVEGPAGENP